MKRILCVCACIIVFLAQAKAASVEEEQRFIAAVKSAFENKDVNALDALTCWDRVPENLKQKQLKGYATEIKYSIKTFALTAPEQPDQEWKDKDGSAYKFNLTITKWLKPAFPPEAHLQIWHSVGEKDGKLFIAAPAPIK
jgi:opacity protein-like surface antigen